MTELDEEKAIRALIKQWIQAMTAPDLSRLPELMDEQFISLGPGHVPVCSGDACIANLRTLVQHYRLDGAMPVQEIKIEGSMAFAWMRLDSTMHPKQKGSSMHRSGDILWVLRKAPSGSWVVFREVSLIATDAKKSTVFTGYTATCLRA